MKETRMDKGFVVSQVTRLDVAYAICSHNKSDGGCPKCERKASKLTDFDMEQLARKMGDCFCDTGYWEAIRAWASE